MNRTLAVLLGFVEENLNFLVVVSGFAVLYVGLSSLSRPVANIVAGVIVMALGAWPYLRVRKK